MSLRYFLIAAVTLVLSLVAALRSLTFHDVFEIDPRLPERLKASPAHLAVIRAASGRKTSPSRAIGRIEYNHVFHWTHSLLSVARDPFFGRSYRNCRGYVETASEVQLAPGHRTETSEKVFLARARTQRPLLPKRQAKDAEWATGDNTPGS